MWLPRVVGLELVAVFPAAVFVGDAKQHLVIS